MEQNKLTNEEKARIFAMYIPCKIVNGMDGDLKERELRYSSIDTYAYANGFQPKLLLTPLQDITDEDAVQLVKIEYGIFDNTGCEFQVVKYSHKNPQVFVTKKGRHYHTFEITAGKLRYEGYQYLVQKGYAVPLFFGVNHWANGKTAIELGIAINKNQK